MLDFGAHIPFVELLGLRLLQFEDGCSELVFEPRPEHLNSFRIVHGGVSMTLLDVAMASAARSVQKDLGAVTVEMKTSFMRPAKGRLTARGRLLHRTPSLAFTEASISDASGKLCAHATGTFKYLARPMSRAGDTPSPPHPATD